MTHIRKQIQDNLDESGDGYILKTDSELIDIIANFGNGETEFHTADIERLLREKHFLEERNEGLVERIGQLLTKNLTDEQKIEIYKIVFPHIHSPGFMTAEVKNLLFEDDYWFIERPNMGWDVKLDEYLSKINFDKSTLRMNPEISNVEHLYEKWMNSKIN